MVAIGGRNITVHDFDRVVFHGDPVELDPHALAEVKKNFDFLRDFSKDKIIYGINTGLGPMSQYKVRKEDQISLQYNLIRSHASGAGKPLAAIFVKALMMARLNTLMKGFSGIHPDAVQLMKDLISENIIPLIPEHGGVGASGDLVQLAHLSLVLIGEGDVVEEGKIVPAGEAFRRARLVPLKMHIREALALINGTSVMSGIGIINIIRAKRLLEWSVAASALINEIVESYDDHYSIELNRVKLHPGQQEITARLREILKDSFLVRKREDHLFNGTNGEKIFSKKIQEYYSIRCITQILGPVADTIRSAESVVLNEINSVNDNPVIDHHSKNVFHGGNFHGDYVSLEMDKLKLAIIRLSMLTERQLNFLMNDKLNSRLQPFINLGVLGLNLGMQGAQFTATSTVAENQALSTSLYVHSIPTNNDNQDIVSMGTNSALSTARVIENTSQVMAIQLMSLLQAVDQLKIQGKLSSYNAGVYQKLRHLVPAVTTDRSLYPDILKVKEYLKENGPNT